MRYNYWRPLWIFSKRGSCQRPRGEDFFLLYLILSPTSVQIFSFISIFSWIFYNSPLLIFMLQLRLEKYMLFDFQVFQCFDWYNRHHQGTVVEWHDCCKACISQNSGRTWLNLVMPNNLQFSWTTFKCIQTEDLFV